MTGRHGSLRIGWPSNLRLCILSGRVVYAASHSHRLCPSWPRISLARILWLAPIELAVNATRVCFGAHGDLDAHRLPATFAGSLLTFVFLWAATPSLPGYVLVGTGGFLYPLLRWGASPTFRFSRNPTCAYSVREMVGDCLCRHGPSWAGLRHHSWRLSGFCGRCRLC